MGRILLHAVVQESRLPEVPPSPALASKVTLGIHIWQADEGKECGVAQGRVKWHASLLPVFLVTLVIGPSRIVGVLGNVV